MRIGIVIIGSQIQHIKRDLATRQYLIYDCRCNLCTVINITFLNTVDSVCSKLLGDRCLNLDLLRQFIINVDSAKSVITQFIDIGCSQLAASSYHRSAHRIIQIIGKAHSRLCFLNRYVSHSKKPLVFSKSISLYQH